MFITMRTLYCYIWQYVLSETIQRFVDEFRQWQMAFDSKDLKVNLGKTNVIVNRGSTEDGLPKVNFTHVGSAA